MSFEHPFLLCVTIVLVAFLYSSVGHAGASGYIATMALFGCAEKGDAVRPVALVLNILVATIGSLQFARAGHFSWRLFWPFALLSVPAAYIGGRAGLPLPIFKTLVGLVLLFSAARFFFKQGDPPNVAPPARPVALGIGAGLGLLSGFTGTGGGIFLTPLMLLCRWARTKNVAAVSSLFILVNSISGLAGFVKSGKPIPQITWPLAACAIAGGAIGSHLGSRHFPARTIQLLLAFVLAIAGLKLIGTK